MDRRIGLMAGLLLILFTVSVPVHAEENTQASETAVSQSVPEISSASAVLMDADTGEVLYDKGMNETRYPASITKLMTLLVAVENSSPDDQVTFTETGIRDVNADSSNIGMQLGEVMSMKDCWYAAIMKSANEVCAQIAETVGGTEAAFVEMMNQKAQELGCTGTHFANASGLPDENHYTTALDMAKIMQAGLQNETFCEVISAVNYKIAATNLSAERAMHVRIDLLAEESSLYYKDCIGAKNGYTQAAGHTLVAAARRDGHTYIVVTLNAAELGLNYTDTISLFDYAFEDASGTAEAEQTETVTVGSGAAAVATNSIEGWPEAPATSSETAVLMDAETGAILYDKGMDDYRYPASTTKIMTLLLATENSTADTQVTFTETGVRDVSGDNSNINMQLGETITMKDCWYAAAIQSANEVCAQIAETIGGSETAFIEMMNQKAQELGCTNTHFTNASGLPDSGLYTTAHDLAKIMQAGLNNSTFRDVIGATDYTIPATNLSAARSLHTHVPLMAKESSLYYEGCIGAKTGHTNDAGYTFVCAAERDGRTYIAVTMKASDLGVNCADTIALFDYAFNNFQSLEAGGTVMSVPTGTSAENLELRTDAQTGESQYYYNGQYVGTAAAAPSPMTTPTPEPVESTESTETADASETETSAESEETDGQSLETAGETAAKEGLSGMAKVLLVVMGVMLAMLIVLIIILHKKERRD